MFKEKVGCLAMAAAIVGFVILLALSGCAAVDCAYEAAKQCFQKE